MKNIKSLTPQNFWTEAECDILRAHYTEMSDKQLMKLLPGRTEHAVSSKLRKMKLRRTGIQLKRAAEVMQPKTVRPQFSVLFKQADLTELRQQVDILRQTRGTYNDHRPAKRPAPVEQPTASFVRWI
jgi:hypothetical protein